MAQNSSEFDLRISLIQEIIAVCNQDSQRVESDIKKAREELEQLRSTVESRNQSCLRELEPRIRQLEEKIQFYWEGVTKMNDMAWKDMEIEDAILLECQAFVGRLQDQLTRMEAKI